MDEDLDTKKPRLPILQSLLLLVATAVVLYLFILLTKDVSVTITTGFRAKIEYVGVMFAIILGFSLVLLFSLGFINNFWVDYRVNKDRWRRALIEYSERKEKIRLANIERVK
ncbi:MAG: hypothetical protein ABIA59_10220, partial [Candidatus Latescibacterota bacterium]